MPNAQHQTFHGFMTGAPYELAIVEFDDQGRCYDRGQMDAVAARLDALAPVDIGGSQPKQVVLIGPIGHEAAGYDKGLERVDRRQAVPGYERDDEIAMRNSGGVW